MSKLHIISLGAGVQSTTMALMAAHGEITPMPDAAIFADTGAEPRAVYDHLEWLMSGNVLPFPVHVVTAGNIVDGLRKMADAGEAFRGRAPVAPFYTTGKNGTAAPLRRQCTGHYKVEPINRWLRRALGAGFRERLPKGAHATVWMGISTDEIYRVKPSQEPWVTRKYPLIDARVSRGDCFEWMAAHGYPRPPRSACTFCPYHSDNEWRNIRDNDPAGWAEAMVVDATIRPGFRSTRNEVFLHRSLVPLGQVDFRTKEDEGQLSMFNDECEGMCGV